MGLELAQKARQGGRDERPYPAPLGARRDRGQACAVDSELAREASGPEASHERGYLRAIGVGQLVWRGKRHVPRFPA
ncbi:MAG TPA: hypothetical protein VGM56_21380 [Byssovorax sp.]